MEEQPVKKKKWYQSSPVIITVLILFFPLGLYLMWKHAHWSKRTKWIVTGIFAFIVIINMVNNSLNPPKPQTYTKPAPSTNTNTNTNIKSTSVPEVVVSVEPKPTTDATPKFSDGTHLVGKDIKPGIYRTRTGSSSCYYARLSGFGGELGDILSNENTDYPAIVEILASDKGFSSSRCSAWTQDISQITKSKTKFTDGMYFIGTDIQPGTYKSSGSTSCYYSRLAGFSGGLGDIISNDNTDKPAIVSIAATDKGFKSSRCGTWTLLE